MLLVQAVLLLELFVVLVGRVEKDIPLLLPPAAPPVKVEQLLGVEERLLL